MAPVPIIYDSSTPIFRPLFDRGLRAAIVFGIEWTTLSLIEGAPAWLRFCTMLLAALGLAVLESKYFLMLKGRAWFGSLLTALILIWLGLVSYAYLHGSDGKVDAFDKEAVALLKSVIPASPDAIADAVGRKFPALAAAATTVKAAPTEEEIEKATAPIRSERDSAKSQLAAANQKIDQLQLSVLPKTPNLHLDDAKRWQIEKAMVDGMDDANSNCQVNQAIQNDGSSESQRTLETWSEVQQPLWYAGWRFTQIPKAFFPAGINITAATENKHAKQCATHLKDLLDALNARPVNIHFEDSSPDLTGCKNDCIAIVIGKLESP